MHALRLALRALWWRRGLSVTILLIGVVSVTAAAVGPLYTRAAEESMLRDRLRSAPVSATGVEYAEPSGVGDTTAAELLADLAQAGPHDLDPYYSEAVLGVQTTDQVAIERPGKRIGSFVTRLLWRDGQCAHLQFLSGSCPEAPYDVAVSAATARTLGVRVGSVLVLGGLGGRTAEERPVVAGVYRPLDPRERYWYDGTPFDAHPPAEGRGASDVPTTLDSVFLTRAGVAVLRDGSPRATQQFLLDVDRVRLDDLARLRAKVAAAATFATAGSPFDTTGRPLGAEMTTSLLSLLKAVEGDRRVVRTSVPLVTLQLLLLTWFVLFLVVAGATEARAGEVALGKLRGLGPVAASALALGEPLLLLALALPIGLLLAFVATHLLTGALVPGTPVQIRGPVFLALAAVLVGGLVAAGLAVRRTLSLPVLEQLRRTAPDGRSRRSSAIDAVVIALAAAAVYQLVASGALVPGQGTELALLTPGLLALAAALVGVRLLPLLTRVWVRRTRRSGRIAAFLSLRQISRRPAGLRIVVLLAVAVALAAFAVDGWQVSADNRAARADQEVGAARVARVEARSTADLVAAVRRADPGGREAMAVSELVGSGGNGRVLAVDSERLTAVAAWRRGWAPEPLAELARRLRPATPPPIVLRGTRIALAATGSSLVLREPVTVVAGLQQGDREVQLPLGRLRAGEQVYRADVPFCVSGCRLRSITLQRPLGRFGSIEGALTLHGITMSGPRAEPVEAGFAVAGRWRAPLVQFVDPSRSPAASASPVPGGLTVAFSSTGGDAPEVDPVDGPDPLPAVLAADEPAEPYAAEPDALHGTGLDGSDILLRRVATSVVLPRTGRTGVLVDLTYADRLAAAGERPTEDQVWLAADASPTVLDRLRAGGVRVLSVQSAASRRTELDRSGPALALLLFLVAAAAALLLAVGAVVTSVYIGGRRRAYELAAMRTFGVGRSVLVRAGASEQLVLLGAGVLLGAAAGVVAATLALPAVPVYADRGVGPPLDFTPAWPTLAIVLGCAVAVLVLVSYAAASRLVGASLPDRLREAPA